MPKVEYPTYFDGIRGTRSTGNIEHREAYISLPFKMVMSVGKAKNHPVLSKIIDSNPKMFDESEDYNA